MSEQLRTALHVLQSVHDAQDLFQAAVALRYGIAASAPSMAAEERSQLTHALAELLGAGALPREALGQVASALALMTKLAWPSTVEAAQSGQPVASAPVLDVARRLIPQGGTARVAGLGILRALLNEFSSYRALAHAMSWETHNAARASFEALALPIVVDTVLGTLAEPCPDAATARAVAELGSAALGWDFQTRVRQQDAIRCAFGHGAGGTVDDDDDDMFRIVRPPDMWRGVLADLTLPRRVLAFYLEQRKFGGDVAALARELLLPLCCTKGKALFPTESERCAYASTLVQCLASLADAPCASSATNEGAAELYSLAVCLAALASNYRLRLLTQVAAETQSDFVALLGVVTMRTLERHPNAETDALWDAFEATLTAWGALLADAPLLPDDVNEPALLRPGAAHVFERYMEVRLAEAENALTSYDELAEQFEDQASLREHLESVAALARASAAPSLRALTAALQHATMELTNVQTTDSDRTERLLERLQWTVMVAAPVVADADDGDAAHIPAEMLRASADAAGNAPAEDPVVHMISTLAELCERSQALSPALAEALWSAASAWAPAYLMYTPSLYKARSPCAEMYLGGENGASMVERLARAALSYACGEGADADAARAAARALARIAAQLHTGLTLARVPVYHELLAALARSDTAVLRDPSILVHLARAAAAAAGSNVAGNVDHARVDQALQAVLASFDRVATAGPSSGTAAAWDAAFAALRGAALASRSTTAAMHFAAIAPRLPLASAAVAHRKEAGALLESFCDTLVDTLEATATFLEAPDIAPLYEACMAAVRLYAASRTDKRSVASESGIHELAVVLHVLSAVASRDIVDFQGTPQQEAVGAVVVEGMRVVLPLLDEEVLAVPEISDSFYVLCDHAAHSYPGKVLLLGESLAVRLVKLLRHGIAHAHAATAASCLEAVAALSKFCATQRASVTPSLRDVFRGILQDVVEHHLLHDMNTDTLDEAAQAWFALAVFMWDDFQRIVDAAMQSLSNATIRDRFQLALQRLFTNRSLTTELTRPNESKFRLNFREFLAEARGFLRASAAQGTM